MKIIKKNWKRKSLVSSNSVLAEDNSNTLEGDTDKVEVYNNNKVEGKAGDKAEGKVEVCSNNNKVEGRVEGKVVDKAEGKGRAWVDSFECNRVLDSTADNKVWDNKEDSKAGGSMECNRVAEDIS